MRLDLGIIHSHDAKLGNACSILKREGPGLSFLVQLARAIRTHVFASAKLFAWRNDVTFFSLCLDHWDAFGHAALLACVTPAGAGARTRSNALSPNALATNAISPNAVAQNGIPASARITTGSALGDLNGVAVEAVTVPDAALR